MRLLQLLPRFQLAYRELATLEARERWSRTEIETFQLERINRLWQQARRTVPYYRELGTNADLPESFTSLDDFRARMPILKRATVKARSRDLLAANPGPGRWVRTGGSTGEPLSCFWGLDALTETLRGKYRFLHSWGVDLLDPLAFLWGHGSSFVPGWSGWLARWRQSIEDWLRGRLRLSAYRLGKADLRTYLRRIAAFRPVGLYAYTTAAFLLAREALELGTTLPSLKLAILTSEPVYPHLAQTVERAFQVPAVTEYGSMECGFLAGDIPDPDGGRSLRVREDHVLLETRPRDDGRHDLFVTILNNPAFPLIRYAIGDVTDEPLRFGPTGFAALKNVAGRDNDHVMTRSGGIVHSAAVDTILELQGDGVRRYTVHQTRDGSLHVLVEADDSCELSLDDARRRLEVLLEGYPVEITVTGNLPTTQAGKHRWIHSELTALQTH